MDLRLGDCFEGMRTLADKSVDMICCDLPYAKTRHRWDKKIDLDRLWKEYKRIIKPQGAIILFGQQPFTSLLVASNIEMFKYNYVWKKEKKTRFLLANYQPLKQTEDILVFSYGGASHSAKQKGVAMTYHPPNLQSKVVDKKNSKSRLGKMLDNINHLGENNILLSGKEYKQYYTNYPCDILEFSVGKCEYHPTQKPVALLEWLIKTYTNEDDLVLDNTFGSGTTAVACKNTKRRFVGWELDEKYYATAIERLNEV